MAQLKEKHPNPQPTTLGSLLFGPIDDGIPESVYSEINGEMVRQAALRTRDQGDHAGSTLMALEESWLANPLKSRLQNYARR